MYYSKSTELYHHGILGMKWGIRRYQNPDGSLTEEGKQRYGYVSDFNRPLSQRQIRDINTKEARIQRDADKMELDEVRKRAKASEKEEDRKFYEEEANAIITKMKTESYKDLLRDANQKTIEEEAPDRRKKLITAGVAVAAVGGMTVASLVRRHNKMKALKNTVYEQRKTINTQKATIDYLKDILKFKA